MADENPIARQEKQFRRRNNVYSKQRSNQVVNPCKQTNPVGAGKKEGPKSKKAGQYMSRQAQDQNESKHTRQSGKERREMGQYIH